MKTLIVIAIRNIRLHWKHSLAATIAIASGFVSLCMFQGYMDDVARLYVDTFSEAKMYGQLIIEHKDRQSVEGRSQPLHYSLNPEDQIKVEQFFKENTEEVMNWTRFLTVSGMISNGRENTIFEGRGYDLDSGAKMRKETWAWDAMYGVPLHKALDPASIHLGYNLAKLLGCKESTPEKVYDPAGGYKPEERPFECKNPYVQLTVTTENEQVNALDLTVAGLIDGNYKEVDNKFIQLSLENAQQLMDTKKISYYTVLLNESYPVKSFQKKFKDYAQKNNLPVDVRPWTEHKVGDMYIRTMQLLSIFRNFIVVVILFIAGLSIFNTMVKIVHERTKEIGTLRSLGFSQKKVLIIFIFESFFLGVLGIVLGAVFSLLASGLINLLGITYKAGVLTQPVVFRIMSSFNLYAVSFLVLITVTLLTSFMATRKAAKKKIIECLTHA